MKSKSSGGLKKAIHSYQKIRKIERRNFSMDYFLQAFGNTTLSTVIVFICAMSFLFTLGMKGYKAVVKYHDDLQKKEDEMVRFQEDILYVKARQVEEMKEIRTKQEILENLLTEVADRQNSILQRQEEFETQSRERSKNKLRDRLLQNYRYYGSTERNPQQAWSEMEKDAFYNLYNDYKDLGGNGFIHSTVEPQLATLEVIPMNKEDKLVELMKSRRS